LAGVKVHFVGVGSWLTRDLSRQQFDSGKNQPEPGIVAAKDEAYARPFVVILYVRTPLREIGCSECL
jgi:hypothetical protein